MNTKNFTSQNNVIYLDDYKKKALLQSLDNAFDMYENGDTEALKVSFLTSIFDTAENLYQNNFNNIYEEIFEKIFLFAKTSQDNNMYRKIFFAALNAKNNENILLQMIPYLSEFPKKWIDYNGMSDIQMATLLEKNEKFIYYFDILSDRFNGRILQIFLLFNNAGVNERKILEIAKKLGRIHDAMITNVLNIVQQQKKIKNIRHHIQAEILEILLNKEVDKNLIRQYKNHFDTIESDDFDTIVNNAFYVMDE